MSKTIYLTLLQVNNHAEHKGKISNLTIDLTDRFLKAVGLDLIRQGKVNRHQYYCFVFNMLAQFLYLILLQCTAKKLIFLITNINCVSPTVLKWWQIFYCLHVPTLMTTEPFPELNIFLLIWFLIQCTYLTFFTHTEKK